MTSSPETGPRPGAPALTPRPSYARLVRRFERWLDSRPSVADLTGAAITFVTTALPAVSRRNGAYALRAQYGDALDWLRLKAAAIPEPPRPSRPPARPRATGEGYAKMRRRFERFLAAHPDGTPTARVVAFLATLTPVQARTARNALRAALDGQVDWRAVPLPRYHRNEPRLRASVLTAEERAQLEAGLPTRERALLAVLLGLRRFEAAALRWRDVNLAAGTLYVAHGKGNKPGTAILPRRARAALAAWHAESRPASPDTPVFPARRTKPANVERDGCPTPDTLGHWVQQILKRAGLRRPYRSAHALRRTFATEFLRSNPKELEQLRIVMRHHSISTTAAYLFLTEDDVRPAVDRVDL